MCHPSNFKHYMYHDNTYIYIIYIYTYHDYASCIIIDTFMFIVLAPVQPQQREVLRDARSERKGMKKAQKQAPWPVLQPGKATRLGSIQDKKDWLKGKHVGCFYPKTVDLTIYHHIPTILWIHWSWWITGLIYIYIIYIYIYIYIYIFIYL